MGGRGASSGVSVKKKKYGSQYHMVYQSGNIKFVSKNSRDSEPLMETMTRGRVYVHVEGEDIKSVVYFDNDNKRSKQVDLDHKHAGEQPHTYHGYNHNELDSAKGYAKLTPKEKHGVTFLGV